MNRLMVKPIPRGSLPRRMNKSKCTPPLQHSIADVRRKQERLGQRSAMWLLVGSWNLAKLPSLTTRLHGPTKATTLGVGGALIASMIYFPVFEGRYSAHELLIAIFLLLTAPVSANMIAKVTSMRRSGEPRQLCQMSA